MAAQEDVLDLMLAQEAREGALIKLCEEHSDADLQALYTKKIEELRIMREQLDQRISKTDPNILDQVTTLQGLDKLQEMQNNDPTHHDIISTVGAMFEILNNRLLRIEGRTEKEVSSLYDELEKREENIAPIRDIHEHLRQIKLIERAPAYRLVQKIKKALPDQETMKTIQEGGFGAEEAIEDVKSRILRIVKDEENGIVEPTPVTPETTQPATPADAQADGDDGSANELGETAAEAEQSTNEAEETQASTDVEETKEND